MKIQAKHILALLWLVPVTYTAKAQTPQQAPPPQNAKPDLRKGNKLYQEKKYKEAQQAYAGALQKDPASATGRFNLGDALYKSKDYENSRKALEASIKATKDKKEQAHAWHNIGNTYLEEKKWEEAANAYKQALKLNPSDADTKYNLAYANAMLKKDGGGKNNKNNKDNKDNKDKKDQQDKDKKDQDKKDQDKKDQDKKDQDKKDQDKKDQQNPKDGDKKDQQPQQSQPQPSKLTKQQAENMLNALQQEEKKLQDKKDKDKGIPVRLEKDW